MNLSGAGSPALRPGQDLRIATGTIRVVLSWSLTAAGREMSLESHAVSLEESDSDFLQTWKTVTQD